VHLVSDVHGQGVYFDALVDLGCFRLNWLVGYRGRLPEGKFWGLILGIGVI